MPKNVLIPQDYIGGVIPPVPEQSILFDRTRQTKLDGFSPANSVGSDLWENACWAKMTNDFGLTRVLWEAFIDVNNFTRLSMVGGGSAEKLRFEAQIGGVVRAVFETGRLVYDPTAWYHIDVQFDRVGGILELRLNGVLYDDYVFGTTPTVDNVAGYAWMDSGANHNVGGDDGNTVGFSGFMADFYMRVGAIEGVTAFGMVNSIGTWTRIAPGFVAGSRDVYLTFGRTADLGEDFSGNANDFPTHTNGGPADQADDWPERNYCTIDVTNDDTNPTVTEGGLVTSSSGRVTMQPAANTGVYYYEKNGVGITHDTGASGRFNPLLLVGSYNFGQFPFVGVGPGGGELTVVSSNLTPSAVPHSRLGFFAGSYDGSAVSPRTVIEGDYGLPAHEAILITDIGLAWAKNIDDGARPHVQTNRLRIPEHLLLNQTDAEDAALANGFIQTFLSTAISVIDGGTDGDNINGAGNVISLVLWAVSKFAQNLVIAIDEDDAEEEASGGGIGTTDVDSSDLEMVIEGGGPLQEVGLRWLNVKIPQGATILTARIQFECDSTNSGTNDLLIFCEDIDNAPTFVDGAANFNISGRTKTTAKQTWSPLDWTVVQRRGIAERTEDILPPVQEVIDRGGWAPGNSLVAIIVEDPAGTPGEREAEAFDAVGGDSDRNTAMLQVAWDNGTLDTGISIFEYAGAGKVAQVMHGLDAVPEFFVVKKTNASAEWRAYHSLIQTSLPAPEDGHLVLNNNSAVSNSSSTWNDTAPDSVFLTVGTAGAVNAHEDVYVGWAMREIEGFSRLFRYVGDGASTGPKIYCGFKPRMLVIKRVDASGDWVFHHRGNRGFSTGVDGLFNQMSGNGYLNTFGQFNNGDEMRVYANGFLVGDSVANLNAVGGEYVGFAFAEAPYQSAKASR